MTITTWLCYTNRVHIKKKGEFIKDHIQVKRLCSYVVSCIDKENSYQGERHSARREGRCTTLRACMSSTLRWSLLFGHNF